MRVAGYGIVNANKVKSNIIIIGTIYFGAFRIILVCRKRVINVSVYAGAPVVARSSRRNSAAVAGICIFCIVFY